MFLGITSTKKGLQESKPVLQDTAAGEPAEESRRLGGPQSPSVEIEGGLLRLIVARADMRFAAFPTRDLASVARAE